LLIKEIYLTAIHAAIEASKEIMRIYNGVIDLDYKEDGSPLTNADLSSSKIINEYLAPLGFPITSEETIHTKYKTRSSWENCWCVDPLDGTKEFVSRNGEFAVNIAYIEGEYPVFGIITSPVNEEIIFGGKEEGVFTCHFLDIDQPLKWKKIQEKDAINNPLNMIGSRSHPSELSKKYYEDVALVAKSVEYLSKGSSLKFFDLANGTADVYPRFAPTMEWDIAAGQAIIEALGGEVSNALDGTRLRYNKEDLTNPFFIAKTKGFIAKYK
jgi:3'(2'), 5'-bisphosphate nucleotidase